MKMLLGTHSSSLRIIVNILLIHFHTISTFQWIGFKKIYSNPFLSEIVLREQIFSHILEIIHKNKYSEHTMIIISVTPLPNSVLAVTRRLFITTMSFFLYKQFTTNFIPYWREVNFSNKSNSIGCQSSIERGDLFFIQLCKGINRKSLLYVTW